MSPTPTERGFFGSLNTIKSLVESTCGDKWDILIETALPAAGDALWLLIVPSPEEILESYLQPRPRRSDPKRATSGHGRRQTSRFGGRRWWNLAAITNVDNIIADALPGREFLRGRSAGGLEKWIWRGVDVLDRGLWWWMLIDLGHDFVVQWSSGIMESRFCTTPLNALLSVTSTERPTTTNQPLWFSTNELVVASNFGWLINSLGHLERDNDNIGVSGQMILDVTGTIDPDSHDPDNTKFLQVSVRPVDAPAFLVTSPAKKTAPGQAFALQISVPLDHVVAFDFVIRIQGEQLSAEKVFGGSWGLTLFMTPDP